MLDMHDAQHNAQLREVIQDVLVDVVNEFANNAEELIKTDNGENVNKLNSAAKEDEKKKEDTEAEKKDTEKKEEESKAMVSNEQDISTDDEMSVSTVNQAESLPTVTAVPKVEVLNNTSNIGQFGVTPMVNNVPATTDVNQTVGNTEAKLNTEITNTRSDQVQISTPEEIPTEASKAPVSSGQMKVFGTNITYTQNENGAFNITFDRNGTIRVVTVPSLMTNDILPELEDFLVESLAGSPTNTVEDMGDGDTLTDMANVSNIPSIDSFPADQTTVPPEVESSAPVPTNGPIEETADDLESKNEEVLSKATMASLRKQYAGKVMEIFQLGLLAKGAIVAESKDKFFAKDKKEYIKKGKLIASELNKKKKGLEAITKEYLNIRNERDSIKELFSIISSACTKSQQGLNEGYLTDVNSDKIVKVISNMAAKVVANYGKPNFGAILSSEIAHANKVKALISSEISNNRKSAVLAAKKDTKLKDNIKKSVNSTVLANKFARIADQARLDNDIINQTKAAKQSNALEASRMKKSPTKEINTVDKLNAREKMKRMSLAHRGTNINAPGVIVEGNYAGRSSDTLGRAHRHDGMDDMIREIVSLI